VRASRSPRPRVCTGAGPASSPRNRSPTPGTGSRPGSRRRRSRGISVVPVVCSTTSCLRKAPARRWRLLAASTSGRGERMNGEVESVDYVALLEAVKDEIAASRVLGGAGGERRADRAARCRPAGQFPRRPWAQPPGPAVHAGFCRSVAGGSAAGCCAIALESHHGAVGPPRRPHSAGVVRHPRRRGRVVTGGGGDHGGQLAASTSGPGAVELSGDLARRRLRPGAGDHPRPRVPAPLPPCWTRGCHQPPQLCHRPGCRSTSPSPVWTVLPVGFELVVGACQCPAATVRSHACSA